jgi:hypothetical protein
MTNEFLSTQPRGTGAELKRAMCHIRIGYFVLAPLVYLPGRPVKMVGKNQPAGKPG